MPPFGDKIGGSKTKTPILRKDVMNAQHLDRYAEILVRHGAGIREGQALYLHADIAHRDLALRVAEAAYDQGAGSVSFWMNDPRRQAQLIRRGRLEDIELSRESERQWFNEIVVRRGAMLSLRGDEDPTLMQELGDSHPEGHAAFNRGTTFVPKGFHAHGIHRNLCPWVVAGAPATGWAKQVFPDLEETAAVDRLAELIFRFTHADHADALERAAEKDRLLHARRRELDGLEIREVHVTGGGSDFYVGLSAKARWLGGSKTTADGQSFNANVPSEENFTTPDRRLTRGHFRATMPFRLRNGILVDGLEMSFEDGRVVDFDAKKGKEGFGRWLDTDDGARYLGEFALVGEDSPIAQSKTFFEHTLFDENASCHAALGSAYATCLEGGPEMSPSELEAIGRNDSVIHTDIMFGSTEVSVVATKSNEGEVVLIENGHWGERFLTAE